MFCCRFLELFRRKLIRLQHLRLLLLGLIARGKLNYINHPEYILMMKEYKKKLTAESIVEAVRVSSDANDQDHLSSSTSAAEQ
jgi:hypothetical protein